MKLVVAASLGLMVAGPIGLVMAVVGGSVWTWARNRPRPAQGPSRRLVLIVILVELRAGQSVLGALQQAAQVLPDHLGLVKVARVAAVAGLTRSLLYVDDELRPVVSQLARSQSSGAPLVGTVRRLLEEDLREERARRLEQTKSLPTRLMVPVALLMLPGIVLFMYGPSLVDLYHELFAAWQ